MATMFAMIGLSIYGYAKGNADLLLAPRDAAGNTCGNHTDPAFKDFKYIYFTDLDADNIFKTSVCVHECPKNTGDDLYCRINSVVSSCGQAQYASEDVLVTCVPTDIDVWKSKFEDQYSKMIDNAQNNEFYQDVNRASRSLLCSLALGLVYVIFFMYLMAHCAHLISYLSIAVIELAHIAVIGGLFYSSTKHKGDPNGFYIGAGVAILSLLIFNCMLCLFWNKVQLAIAIIDATADFMVATKRLAFVSLSYFFITILYVIFWGVAAVGVIAMNPITANEDGSKNIEW